MARNALDFNIMIVEEYKAAKEKHSKFCDVMTFGTLSNIKKELTDLRLLNNHTPYAAFTILDEEIHEAAEAYLKGDKEHCLQELAQCGAVVLRMMEFVQNEIDNKKE